MIHVIQSMNHSFEAFEPSPENGGHTDMITIFNRKELAITYSMKEQARIRDILTAEGIDYIIDTKGTVMRNMGARARHTAVWREYHCQHRIQNLCSKKGL